MDEDHLVYWRRRDLVTVPYYTGLVLLILAFAAGWSLLEAGMDSYGPGFFMIVAGISALALILPTVAALLNRRSYTAAFKAYSNGVELPPPSWPAA